MRLLGQPGPLVLAPGGLGLLGGQPLGLLLGLVPVPLVDLARRQPELLGQLVHRPLGPVGLLELGFQRSYLRARLELFLADDVAAVVFGVVVRAYVQAVEHGGVVALVRDLVADDALELVDVGLAVAEPHHGRHQIVRRLVAVGGDRALVGRADVFGEVLLARRLGQLRERKRKLQRRHVFDEHEVGLRVRVLALLRLVVEPEDAVLAFEDVHL
mmetsp:Transcript_21016/g.24231  ORF Transcript_21016/g.24231 Transcript_21016/m.24231 type:complete len:214 (-) Transcript_21016:36-677(-)